MIELLQRYWNIWVHWGVDAWTTIIVLTMIGAILLFMADEI